MKVTVLPYIDATSTDTAAISKDKTSATAAATESVVASAKDANAKSDFSISLQNAERTLTAMTIDFVTSLNDVEQIQRAAQILSTSNASQLREIGQALLSKNNKTNTTENTASSAFGAENQNSVDNNENAASVSAVSQESTSTDAASSQNGSVSSECSDVSSRLECPSDLQSYFQEASEKYDVDIALLESIAKAESNFRTDAKSSAGAAGVMQLMPSTAKGLGVSDSYDAQQNILGGAKLISSLLDKYEGDTSLALAAYNAGSGNVAKYGGIPPFKETQNYITKVLGYYKEATS